MRRAWRKQSNRQSPVLPAGNVMPPTCNNSCIRTTRIERYLARHDIRHGRLCGPGAFAERSRMTHVAGEFRMAELNPAVSLPDDFFRCWLPVFAEMKPGLR